MEKEIDQEVEITEDEEEVEEKEETPKPKPKLTPEQQRGILQRKLTKLNKELGIEEKPVKAEKPEEKKGFDLAERAYLKSSGITPDEYPLVQEIMASTGKELEEVLEAKYFQAELKELRETKASAEAVPKGTGRSSQSSKDKVDYWLAKKQLPPADQPELRKEYVNAKLRAETSGNPFSDIPVVQ
jgi:hypothetical protein